MRRVEAEALVGASRDEVWQLLDDLAGMPRWAPGVRGVTASGASGPGTVYRERFTVVGVPQTREWEVTEHRRPARQVRVARDGGVERSAVLGLDARGSGTRLRVEVELRSTLPAPLGLAHELLLALPARVGAQRLAGAVKRVFEGPRR